MVHPDHPARANIEYLEQGVALIDRLADGLYAAPPPGPYPGGVGAQFRHCLDFYDCFLRDLPTGRIDYGRRSRDARIETDRAHAKTRAHAICVALRGLDHESIERMLEVRAEDAELGRLEWSGSSAGRELQFLISHTIHHYALIAVLLAAQGYDVSREFPELGVAPSTLEHWNGGR
jgi:uncharacterized damage-inducible protein DinB